MKQKYRVHYKKSLIEYDDNDFIDVEVPEVNTCPNCNIATSPTFVDGFYIKHPDFEVNYCYIVLYCPRCSSLYTARYFDGSAVYGSSLNNLFLDSVFPKTANKISFSDNIKEISPEFVSLYNQAAEAEKQDEIKGLAGLGYRKSLEFLVKDFLIKVQHEDKDTIIKMELGKCINKLPSRLQDIARASIWIGNDEVHYFRKNPEYDIEDLKSFIECLIHFLEIEYTYNKAKNLVNKK